MVHTGAGAGEPGGAPWVEDAGTRWSEMGPARGIGVPGSGLEAGNAGMGPETLDAGILIRTTRLRKTRSWGS